MPVHALRPIAICLVVVAVAAAASACYFLWQWQQTPQIPYEVCEVPAVEEEDSDAAKKTGVLPECPVDWAEQLESVVAWVQVPGTTIDYPVVQASASDESYYLTHDASGNYSAWGVPFIDASCTSGTKSPLLLINGHNMTDGSMFAPLASFSSEFNVKNHRSVYLFTRSDETLVGEVFAVDVVDATTQLKELPSSKKGLKRYVRSLCGSADVVLDQPKGYSQVVALSTCSYEASNSRTLVYAAVK